MIFKVTSRIAHWGRLLFLPFHGCSSSRLPEHYRNFQLSSTLLLCLCFSAVHGAEIQLNSDSEISTAGFYQLSWQGDSESFVVQESRNKDFKNYKTIYQGRDLATVISGKADGDYYYRVTNSEADNASVSNVIRITVAHHPLSNALMFFAAGAIVFIATLLLILKGNRQQAPG